MFGKKRGVGVGWGWELGGMGGASRLMQGRKEQW